MNYFGRSRGSGHGAFIVDRDQTILGLDQAMETLTGWPATEIVGQHKELGHPRSGDDGPSPLPLTAPLYEGEIPVVAGSNTIPLTLHCRDGRRIDVETAADRLSGPGERMLVTILRIVARSPDPYTPGPAERHDELTGFPAAEVFATRLSEAFRTASREAQPLALVVADIDHLREINDRLGRDAGDDVLRKLSGILRVSVDDESHVCRLSNDDFAILLPRAGRGEARQLAAGLRSTVERYRFLPARAAELRVTLSLGAASFPADAESEGDLMARAMDALEEARGMGRNRVWCYLRRPRVPLQVPVFFDAAEAPLVGYTRDLSPSGIFVQTSAPMEIGMRCALTFPLPGQERKVHVIARIVRTVSTDFCPEASFVRIPGMGVEFERFSGRNDRRAIESFLHHHEGSTLRPEVGTLSV